MFENINETHPKYVVHYRKIGGMVTVFLCLTVLSLLSGLLILSPWLIMRPPSLLGNYSADVAYSYGLSGLFYAMIILVQWLAILPMTGIVLLIYRVIMYFGGMDSHKMNRWVRVGVPLLINILAASYYSFSFPFVVSYSNISASLLSRNLDVSIKEEGVVPSNGRYPFSYTYEYRVVLHTVNNTGRELYLLSDLGDHATKIYEEYGYSTHVAGNAASNYDNYVRIPLGVSETEVRIPLRNYRKEWFCDDGVLGMPLHFVYIIGSLHTIAGKQYVWSSRQVNGVLPVGQSINDSIRELICFDVP